MKQERSGTSSYVRLDNLSVGYQGHAIIRDIAVSIEKGEVVTLIGPNGAGKSTILKSIARQLALIGGAVYLDGGDIGGLSYADLSRRMAVMFTDHLRPELMTCFEVASAGRYPYTGRLGILSDHDREVVEQALSAVHASDLALRPFRAVSDGQRQRVLLARAICQEPDVLVLDEPTSYLDIRHKLDLLAILRKMAKQQGITVLLSLHEIDLAMKVSDRVVCVKGDRIGPVGPPEEVLADDAAAELYDLDAGSFDPLLGSAELPPVLGEPEVLVVSSGGTGIPVYRRLQREQIPFAAGILGTNDLDYRLAKTLASRVIETPPFTILDEGPVSEAIRVAERCRVVVDAGVEIGPVNEKIAEVLSAARQMGKLTDDKKRA